MEEEIEKRLIDEIDMQGLMLKHLVYKLEHRARTQGDVDGRMVAIGRTELQKGFMALRRAVTKGAEF